MAVPWETIISTVVETMKPNAGSVVLLGQSCNYKSSKRISGFKLKFDGVATCGAWPGCRGSSCTNSEMGSIKHACKDLLQQAASRGFIPHEEAQKFSTS